MGAGVRDMQTVIAVASFIILAGSGFLAFGEVKGTVQKNSEKIASVESDVKESKSDGKADKEKLEEEIDKEENINIKQQEAIERNTVQQHQIAEYLQKLNEKIDLELKQLKKE